MMKKLYITLIVLAALGVLAMVFFAGYYSGHRDGDRQYLALNLDTNVGLYQQVERGDLGGVKSQLGILIYSQFNTYEERFGEASFVHFDDARTIVMSVATNADEASLQQ
jgi:hypothetical protein